MSYPNNRPNTVPPSIIVFLIALGMGVALYFNPSLANLIYILVMVAILALSASLLLFSVNNSKADLIALISFLAFVGCAGYAVYSLCNKLV